MSDHELDVSKQILTAIITLLTTVVGFYFGSQSALGVLKATKLAAGETRSGQEAGGTTDPKTDPDAAQDGCPSDAQPGPGEPITADKDLPPTVEGAR